MSRRVGPHHNMLLVKAVNLRPRLVTLTVPRLKAERGYTLVALLALMTVLALFAMAAAPSIQQQAQRERELEAIFRGEQMAEAIRAYYSYQQSRLGNGDAALPTSTDQLLEGLPSGSKKVQILRASASRDPLSDSGEWRLVRPRSSELSDFQQALILYAENFRPTTHDPQLKQVEQLMAPAVLPTLGIASPQSGSVGEETSSGPFIGVASLNKNKSVINYYGIDRHSEWIFTPLFR
jgi:type II secretory pathway pseudopilin PulG